MKASFVLYVSACILVEAESAFGKDNTKCQDRHSWCKTVSCDNPGISDTCPMTCGRCNSTVNCGRGQYWNGSNCEECWDGMPSKYRGMCPCTTEGRWGVNCKHECGKGCLDGICDPLSGECANCTKNRYSKMCEETCDNCANCTDTPSNCHRTTGTCLCGCSPGFYGTACDQRCNSKCRSKSCNSSGLCVNGCKEGHFGPRCDTKCGECVDKSCSRIGKCLKGCNTGWYGKKCNATCSNNCKLSNCHQNGTCLECLNGFHGDQCQEHCSAGCATKRCNSDGSCQCRKGYFGHQCRSVCSVNCRNTSCNQTSGECKHSCGLGWYGATCSTRCPDNCSAGACNRYHGSCLSCRDGFRGTYCNMSCYGPHCNQSCHCLISRCDGTGSCTGCQKGYYGQKCSSTCPPRCDTCEQHTGVCITCVEGWRGHMCNESYVRSLRQLVRVLSSFIGVVLLSAVIAAAFIIIRKTCTGSPRGIYISPVRNDHLESDDISLQEFGEGGESAQSHYETIPDSQAGYEALSPSASHTSGYTALLQSADDARVTAD